MVTHAGISNVPDNLTLVSAAQMIKGVGSYNDFETVANSFVENTPDNFYQIHGHRNTKHLPVQVNDRVFNLEGRVEFGGELRAVQLWNDGTHHTVMITNTVFDEPEEVTEEKATEQKTVADTIMELRNNRYIQEKRHGNISAFNFTKSAFYDRVWDEQTIKARGLYINIPEAKVVARAYDKFFNINERPETKLEMLEYSLSFPVTAYVKENGFLGIVSYNDETDDLFITTKSSPDGDYAVWLRGMLESMTSENDRAAMRFLAKDANVSFVFECVDMAHDPHIIEYDGNKLFLLDIVSNNMNFHKLSYDQVCKVAESIHLTPKERAYVIEDWPAFFDWYYEVTSEDYLYNGRHIEGFVVEDQRGFMVKLKLQYYNFWKYMRAIAHEAIRKGHIDGKRTASLTTALANQFYGWVRTLHDAEDRDALPKDICTLRRMFFATEAGKVFAE